jgi:iron(III) transport system substrate-binding protein
MKTALLAFAATVLAAIATPSMAQEPPALASAAPAQKAALQQMIAAAKQEGEVSYYDTIIQPTTNDLLTAGFRKYYGLPDSFKVNYTLTQSILLVTRIEQEISANRISIDMASVASPTWLFAKVHDGKIMQYASPEYQHYGKVFEAGLGQPDYFAFNGAYLFLPMWNADNVDFKGTTYKEFLDATKPGLLNIGDAGNSESYLATYIGERTILPLQYFKDMATRKPAMIGRSEMVASRMVSGQDDMSFSGMPTRAYQNNDRGANLKFLIPAEGVVLLPQCSFIMAGAPHPNAAKLWLDFILSEQGQTILAKQEALISGRSGFTSPIPTYAPSIDTLKLIKIDWKTMPIDAIQKAKAEWLSIFAR